MFENILLQKTQLLFEEASLSSRNFTLIVDTLRNQPPPQGIMQEEMMKSGDTVERLLHGHPLREEPPPA